MPRRLFVFSGLLLALFFTVAWFVPGRIASAIEATTPAAPSPNSSLMFIENVGQFADDARFQVRGSDRAIWLAEDALWVTLWELADPTTLPDPETDPLSATDTADSSRRGVNIRLSFVGANPAPEVEATEALSTTISYFYGNDPAEWRPDVPVWSNVRYADLYPGLDLELGGVEVMRPRLVCRVADCTAALANVALQVEGAERVVVEEAGLSVTTAVGSFSLPWLEVVDAAGRPVDIGKVVPAVTGDLVWHPYISMPAVQSTASHAAGSDLLYSTFLGSSDYEYGRRIAVDEMGKTYIIGSTSSADFPTTPGAFDTSHSGGSWDVFVAKLNTTGSSLLYSTFLGGSGGEPEDVDFGRDIAVDGTGNAYVIGETVSIDFPTTPDAFDPTHNGGQDTFVTKLNETGSGLLYSTFLGGWQWEYGNGIAVDGAGNAYVTGHARSLDFPTTPGAFDTTNSAGGDVFVTKLNAAGSSLLYSTYLGGELDEVGYDIAVDEAGHAYVTGTTRSPDFPTTPGTFDMTHNGEVDAFVTKLNTTGTALLYSTYLGGSGAFGDSGRGIAVDGTGNAYVTGGTYSPDFPTTPGAFNTIHNGGEWDAFVTKLNATGSNLLYSTFLGGLNKEEGHGIAVNGAGHAYVTGYTHSTNFPTTTDAFDTTHNGIQDVFFTKLNAAGSSLLYSTFLGSENVDYGYGIAVDGAGNTYITGRTFSASFPITSGAFDTTFNGHADVFIARFFQKVAISADFIADPASGIAPLEVAFSNLSSGDYETCLWDFGDGGTSSECADLDHLYGISGSYAVSLTVTGPGGKDTFIAEELMTVYEPVTAGFMATPTSGTVPLLVAFPNLSTGDFDTCLWNFGDGNTSDECYNLIHIYSTPGTYTVTLAVSGPGGEALVTQENYVTVTGFEQLFLPVMMGAEK